MSRGDGLTRPKRRAKPAAGKAVTPRAAAAAATPAGDPPAAQPTANAVRGEHELLLAGVTYRLRPAREAIIAIEKKTGSSIVELAMIGNGGGLGLEVMATIASELVRAGADDELTRMITPIRLQELIYEQGYAKPMSQLTTCLIDSANGGRTAAGNAKAAAG